jgi:hypothetical protein
LFFWPFRADRFFLGIVQSGILPLRSGQLGICFVYLGAALLAMHVSRCRIFLDASLLNLKLLQT